MSNLHYLKNECTINPIYLKMKSTNVPIVQMLCVCSDIWMWI